jgi:hypothetical protein
LTDWTTRAPFRVLEVREPITRDYWTGEVTSEVDRYIDDALVTRGGVPMVVLARNIDEFVAKQKRKPCELSSSAISLPFTIYVAEFPPLDWGLFPIGDRPRHSSPGPFVS